MTMQRVLIIGGAGKQAASIYLPIVLDRNRDDLELAAIADVIDPYGSCFSTAFSSSMYTHNTAWIALTDDTTENLRTLDEYLSQGPIDTLIISCPPLFHHAYVHWG